LQDRRSEVVEDVRRDHQVERTVEAEFVERFNGAEAKVAASAPLPDSIGARIHPGVARAGAEFLEDWLPAPFAGAHIEHRAKGSPNHLLRGRHREIDLADEIGARADGMARMPIPLLEVVAIVSLLACHDYSESFGSLLFFSPEACSAPFPLER